MALARTQKQFWDDFAKRMAGPFAGVFSKLFMDVMFTTPLARLPEDVRAVVGPLRVARREILERLVPASMQGARRRAFLRGIEAGAANLLIPPNPFPRSGRLWRAWEAGCIAGVQWASTKR